MAALRVAVAGATGKTGGPVARGIEAAGDLDLAARVAPSLAGSGEGAYGLLAEALAEARPDVVVDFTRPDLVEGHCTLCIEAKVPLVLGTSGLTQELRDDVDEEARERGVPVFWAPNFAIGAVLMMRFAEQAARILPRAEIIEQHNERKLDAPSGTAAVTAERIVEVTGEKVAIHSVRLPGLVAHQEVLFGGDGQLLTIRHDTFAREAFVPGVLAAVRAVRSLPAGLTVGLERLLDE
jgi:4-hydroxy-tetrahydrodipicolinate reductase